MNDTKMIKKNNVNLVKEVLHSLDRATKQDVARASGLSVATCNTILNELEQTGEVFFEEIHSSQVGRKAKLYHLNYNYKYICCMYFKSSGRKKTIYEAILNLAGEVLEDQEKVFETIDFPVIAERVGDLLGKFPKISYISIGVPGVGKDGAIGHCDIEELIGLSLSDKLQSKYGIPVNVESDMHVMAYGLYEQKYLDEDTTVSIMIFPEATLPGSGTVVSGKMIKGISHFAGELGFLDYGMNRRELLKMCTKSRFIPVAARAAVSLIVMLNPKVIVLTGDLVDDTAADVIIRHCKSAIPDEHLPQISYEKDIRGYYLKGLFSIARENMDGEAV